MKFFSYKSDPNIAEILGYFEKCHYLQKPKADTSWSTFEKTLAFFIPSSGHTADKEFVREILVEVLLEMYFDIYGQSETTSVTRLGNLMHFGQLFQACGDNYFAQIAHIFRQFVEMF